MALPKLTGPDTQIHTVVSLHFPTVQLDLKVVYIPGPEMDRILENARQIAVQRALDAHAVKIGDLIKNGRSAADAEKEAGEPETGSVLVDDIARPVLAAGVSAFRTVEPADPATEGLGDRPTQPGEWEPFDTDDADEAWNTWPEWAKQRLYRAVRDFSQAGTADPKGR